MPPRSDHQTSSVTEARGRKSAPRVVTVLGATLLTPLDALRIHFLMYNEDGNNAVYIGRTNAVTAATGIPIDAANTFEDITSYDAWWAITDGDPVNVRLIVTAVDA